MTHYPLNEIVQFLKPESRIDLKHISLDHLLGLSGSEEGVNLLIKNSQVIDCIVQLTDDKVDEVCKNALLLLVNVTAYEIGASKVLTIKPGWKKNIIELFIGYVTNAEKHYADAACMILCNLTRVEQNVKIYENTFLLHLNDIINVFINVNFNQKGSNLHYLAPLFSNLSCSPNIRKWFTEENPHVPLTKLLPFCNYAESSIRRGGSIGTVRNISFDTAYHKFLLSSNMNLLTFLLLPLMGNEDYPDEEMDTFPLALQYLPQEKKREVDCDIRKMILETLNKFCAKCYGREVLRNNGVYYILREYHKWEKNRSLLLACENVVDILIQKENEVGVEDLSVVKIPEDLKIKFETMDEEYINSA